MQKGPCLNLNKAVETCKHIAKDHANNNRFVHLRVSSSRVGFLFCFDGGIFAIIVAADNAKSMKLLEFFSWPELLMEALTAGTTTLHQVFYV